MTEPNVPQWAGLEGIGDRLYLKAELQPCHGPYSQTKELFAQFTILIRTQVFKKLFHA